MKLFRAFSVIRLNDLPVNPGWRFVTWIVMERKFPFPYHYRELLAYCPHKDLDQEYQGRCDELFTEEEIAAFEAYIRSLNDADELFFTERVALPMRSDELGASRLPFSREHEGMILSSLSFSVTGRYEAWELYPGPSGVNVPGTPLSKAVCCRCIIRGNQKERLKSENPINQDQTQIDHYWAQGEVYSNECGFHRIEQGVPKGCPYQLEHILDTQSGIAQKRVPLR